jgi:multidrug efflux system membrane fusion protein
MSLVIRHAIVAHALIAAATLFISACGGAGKPPETPRPVLVTRAGDAAPTMVAFAGEIRAREESALSFRVGGKLIRRDVDVGARVKRGDLLAVLDPGDLRLQAQAAQAQLAAAEAELVRARADQARYARLAKEQLVSRSALDAQNAAYQAAAGQVRAARANLDVARNQAAYAELRAPRDGAIASRQAEAGQVVAAGQTIFTLAGGGGREVAIALPESRIRSFSVGQPVLVELWSAPGQRLHGTIREIAPAADPQARTYAARIALRDDAARAVELGQSARVYIPGDSRVGHGEQAAMILPLSALQRGPDDRNAVWVVDPATRRVHATPIRTGAFGEDSVTVLGGLKADALVVSAGGHLLRENQRVTPVDRNNRPIDLAQPKRLRTGSDAL